MSQEHETSPHTEPAEERITLRMQVHTDAPSHGIVLREGPKPTLVRDRIPRIARLLAFGPSLSRTSRHQRGLHPEGAR